jgi:hypothetical protein
LDKATRYPQVVVTQYTGGPHCCTDTAILTEVVPGKWEVIDGYTFQWGYSFEDINDDGAAELFAVYQEFLYFDGYFNGPGPFGISRLSGRKLTDITHASASRNRYHQEIAALEFEASVAPAQWHDNQFLAKWVTTKAVVGELSDAWQKAMSLYDQSVLVNHYCPGKPGEFGHTCTISFPALLAELLEMYHFGRPPIALGQRRGT